MFTCRPVDEEDAELLLCLARSCPPLDVHTPYTYWVICHLYHATTIVLEEDRQAIGYVMAVPRGRTLFVWQVGILETHRGLGLSAMLFDALAESASGNYTSLELTIAPENVASFGALSGWCRRNNLVVLPQGPIVVPEHDEPGEILYRVDLVSDFQDS